MVKQEKRLYKVSFYNEGKVYEVYVRSVVSSNLFGFIELEEMVFGEKSKILIDPTEDVLRTEFDNTKRIFIPMHSLIRIDEMKSESVLKPRVLPLKDKGGTRTKKTSNQNPRLSPIYTPTNPFTKK